MKTQVVYSDVRPDVWQLIEKAGSLQTSIIYPGHVKVNTHCISLVVFMQTVSECACVHICGLGHNEVFG